MSDSPSHFNNEKFSLVCKGFKFPHHFTLPICHELIAEWSVSERSALRSISSELQLYFKEWRSLRPLVQCDLNSSPFASVGPKAYSVSGFQNFIPSRPRLSFLRHFIGLHSTRPLMFFFHRSHFALFSLMFPPLPVPNILLPCYSCVDDLLCRISNN